MSEIFTYFTRKTRYPSVLSGREVAVRKYAHIYSEVHSIMYIKITNYSVGDKGIVYNIPNFHLTFLI
jgi:hypothetical protein